MNFVFLMDPLSTVQVKKDTSLILMLGAHRKGHHVYYLPKGGLSVHSGAVRFHVTEVLPQINEKAPFLEERNLVLKTDEVDVVFIRTDPPFDYDYLMHTWLLDRLPKNIFVMNDHQGIRSANEKIWTTQFASVIPPTLVGRNREDLLGFIQEYGKVVAKPTDGFGGQSVFCIQENDLNLNVILETLTINFTRDIILQTFIEEASQGDKRILLLDGEPLGAVLRQHAQDDHRNNFFSGGTPVETNITDRDRVIIKTIQPQLKKLGLFFVGIDILGEYLIEINVTSPTCLQEMNHFYQQSLEDRVIEFVEAQVHHKRSL